MPTDRNSRAQLYALLSRPFLEKLDRPLALYLRGLLRGADSACAPRRRPPGLGAQGQVWRGRVAAGLALLGDLAREHHDSLNRET